jgi:hypothetical protein
VKSAEFVPSGLRASIDRSTLAVWNLRSVRTLARCKAVGGHRMDEFKAAASGNAANADTARVRCEQCLEPMTRKFTTLGLTEPGKVSVYECVDCGKLSLIPEPPVATRGASS